MTLLFLDYSLLFIASKPEHISFKSCCVIRKAEHCEKRLVHTIWRESLAGGNFGEFGE